MRITRAFERALDLEPILRSLGVLYSQNNSHLILKRCPMRGCKSKFMIDKHTKMWVCFACARTDQFEDKTVRGNLFTLMRDCLQLSRAEMQQIIGTGEVMSFTDPDMMEQLQHEEDDRKSLEKMVLPPSLIRLDASIQSVRQFPEVYRYLIPRKVTDPLIYRLFDLRYDPAKKRVVFPVYVDKTTIVGWQARDITERYKQDHPKCVNEECRLKTYYYFKGEEKAPSTCPGCDEPLSMEHYPKSMNSKNFPKSLIFFNQQNVDWSKPVAIVEGPFDCINTPNSVAMLGKAISKTQLAILLDKAKDLTLYLDGDEAGLMSTAGSAKLLRPFFDSLRVCEIDSGKDPGLFSREENTHHLVRAEPSDSWLMRHPNF